jgi:hypothetical protein
MSRPQPRVARSIRSHPNQPTLHLLGEGTENKWIGPSLPCVEELHLRVRDCFYRKYYGSIRICRQYFHRLIFASPNLRSLSIEGPLEGTWATQLRTNCFTPRPTGTFPPIQNLTMSGYSLFQSEWTLWGDRFDWSQLESLTLGPRPVVGLLENLTCASLSLKRFTMELPAANSRPCAVLLDFLMSFRTLETLRLVNSPTCLIGVLNHPELKELCLHQSDPWPNEKCRYWINDHRLKVLDMWCPELKSLELDLSRVSGEWVRLQKLLY